MRPPTRRPSRGHMGEDMIRRAKQGGFAINRRSYRRTFGRLFPADNPHSAAMYRLAIIRDDIDFEIEGVTLTGDPDVERFWRHNYFFRRLTRSIDEAKHLFVHDIPLMLDGPPLENVNMEVLREATDKVKSALETLTVQLKPYADAVGGHVRPSSARDKDEETEEIFNTRALAARAQWEGDVDLDRAHGIGSSFRGFTAIAFLFPWPDVNTVEAVAAKLGDPGWKVPESSVELLHAIDAVLFAFWLHVGAVDR